VLLCVTDVLEDKALSPLFVFSRARMENVVKKNNPEGVYLMTNLMGGSPIP
jgi:hypothetical protein